VPCFRGMAVAQAQGESAVRPSGERGAVPNAASGGATRVDRGQARKPTRMVLEATGGLERAVTSAWATAGLPVVVVPPPQVRDGARATGQLAPTEAWDARARAPGADVIRPTPRPLPDAQTQERRALLGRRQPWLGRRTAEPHRLAGTSARLTKAMAAPMTWLQAGSATRDDALETRRRASPRWREHDDLWQRAKGMGPGCARTWGGGHAPRWGRAHGSRARPWSAWRPSMATVGPSAVGTRSGAGARLGAPGSTGARWWPHAATRRSPCLTSGSSARGTAKKSP
jgi:transposase